MNNISCFGVVIGGMMSFQDFKWYKFKFNLDSHLHIFIIFCHSWPLDEQVDSEGDVLICTINPSVNHKCVHRELKGLGVLGGDNLPKV